MKKVKRFIIANILAIILGFLPIAIFPLDDPLLLGVIAILRVKLGIFLGYVVFSISWGLIGFVALAIYQLGIKFKPLSWLEKIVANMGGKYVGEVKPQPGWKGRIVKMRIIAAQMGADRTFITIALGPVFAVPICNYWGWYWKRPSTIMKMMLLGFIFGTVWYLWYAGAIWSLINWIINKL